MNRRGKKTKQEAGIQSDTEVGGGGGKGRGGRRTRQGGRVGGCKKDKDWEEGGDACFWGRKLRGAGVEGGNEAAPQHVIQSHSIYGGPW